MLKEIFDINTFNILNDDEYYYFLRALNKGDIKDVEDKITIKNDEIYKIRTDSKRYKEKRKYNDRSKLTLEEMFDHIKMNHRLDTNCISLSINANVSIMYGREYYKDRYILVKSPKDNNKIINAGLYLLEEVEKKLSKYKPKDDLEGYFLEAITNAKTKKKLEEIKSLYKKSINKNYNNDTLVHYSDLNNKQNLEKDKIMMKLLIINKNIIPDTPNIELIQAIDNAFSSLEFIHYKDIKKTEIIEIAKEYVDALAILQQLPNDKEVEEIKSIILKSIDKKQKDFKYENNEITNTHLIENMYNITEGKTNFKDAYSVYKKSFYLVKSKLRKNYIIDIIKKTTKNNYEDVYIKLEDTYAVEPKIFSKQNEYKYKVNNVVELNLSLREIELLKYVNSLNDDELTSIIKNPNKELNKTLKKLRYIKKENINKEDYYKDALISLANSEIERENFNIDVIHNYDKLKEKYPDEEIAKILIKPFEEKRNVKISNKLYIKKKNQ